MRSLLLALALIPTLTLSAGSPTCGCDTFEGWYAGAAAGVATNMVGHSTKVQARYNAQMEPGDVLFLSSHADLYRIQPWGEIYTGWGLRFCNWIYLGGRFGINFSSFNVNGPLAKTSDAQNDPAAPPNFAVNLSNKARTDAWTVEYTLDFKPGIVWCDRTLLFGIVGAAFNRTTLDTTSNFVYADEGALNTSSRIRAQKQKTSTGLRGGLGIEHMLTRCLSLNLTYVYTSYWDLTVRGQGDTQAFLGVVAGGHTASFSSTASKQVTSIGASYYF